MLHFNFPFYISKYFLYTVFIHLILIFFSHIPINETNFVAHLHLFISPSINHFTPLFFVFFILFQSLFMSLALMLFNSNFILYWFHLLLPISYKFILCSFSFFLYYLQFSSFPSCLLFFPLFLSIASLILTWLLNGVTIISAFMADRGKSQCRKVDRKSKLRRVLSAFSIVIHLSVPNGRTATGIDYQRWYQYCLLANIISIDKSSKISYYNRSNVFLKHRSLTSLSSSQWEELFIRAKITICLLHISINLEIKVFISSL